MPDPARPSPEPRTTSPAAAPASSKPSNSTTPDIQRTGGWERPPELASAAVTPSGYEILGELGRGGMGVVYKAHQVAANRLVALKMILSGGHASATDRQRFRTEAEAIARLNHPHIVQVYEVGEHNGFPFFSLELCGGGSLARKLDGTPLSAEAGARLCEQLAEAVAVAHRQGIIHRDLKPGNILLQAAVPGAEPSGRHSTRRPASTGKSSDKRPEAATATLRVPAVDLVPKITDFGLAKQIDTEQEGPTRSDAVMGTPSYMSPEQAFATKRVGPPSDVYALGAILYECLTGRPPFKGANVLETLDQVRHRDPVPPRQLNPAAPRDLETICLKCLEKSPERRYGSADELAADLRRFRCGEPIKARPVGVMEKTVKLARRHPTITGLLSLIAVLTVISIVALVIQNGRVTAQRDVAEKKTEEALTAESNAKAALEKRDIAFKNEQAARGKEKEALLKAKAAEQAANEKRELAEATRSEALLAAALHALASGERIRARETLLDCRERDRGWEWYWLFGQTEMRERRVFSPGGAELAAVDPKERWLAVCSAVGQVRIFSLSDARQLVSLPTPPQPVGAMAFTPDGSALLLACRDGRILRHDPMTGRLLGSAELNVPAPGDLLFSPDATRLLRVLGRPATAGTIHDTATGKQVATWRAPGPLAHMTFAPDGKRFAFASHEPANKRQSIHIHDSSTGKSEQTLTDPNQHLSYPLISPDGQNLVVLAGADTLQLRELASGKVLTSVRRACTTDRLSLPYVFTPDGTHLLIRHPHRPGVARVWDVRRRIWLARSETISFAPMKPFFLSADGARLISLDSQSVVWHDFFSVPPAWLVPGSAGTVALTFHPKTGQLALLASSGIIRLHDSRGGQVLHELGRVKNAGRNRRSFPRLVFSPDGEQLAVTTGNNVAEVLDSRTGKPVVQIPTEREIESVAWSGDGKMLAVCTPGGSVFTDRLVNGRWQRTTQSSTAAVSVWDVPGKRLIRKHSDPEWRDWSPEVFFTPDGAHYGFYRSGKRFVIWEARTGKQVAEGWGQLVSWSRPRGGPALPLVRQGGNLHLWDGRPGQTEDKLQAPPLPDQGFLQLTPDLRRLFVQTQSSAGVLEIWSTQTGHRVHEFPERITHMAMSPDGVALAVLVNGRALVRRAPVTGIRPRLQANLSAFSSVAFSANGKQLLTPGYDRQFRLWDVETGRLLSKIPGLRMNRVGFSKDGTVIWGVNVGEYVRAFHSSTGAQLPWSEKSPASLARSASVSVRHGLVIGIGKSGELVAIAYADGSSPWSFAGKVAGPPHLSPNEDRVAVTDGKSVSYLEVGTGKPCWPPLSLGAPLLSVEGFTRDGRALLVSSRAPVPAAPPGRMGMADHSLLLLDAATGKVKRTIAAGPGAQGGWSVLPDGKRVTFESLAGAATFDLESGKPVPLVFPHRPVERTALSPDGRFLVEVAGGTTQEKYVLIRPAPTEAQQKEQDEERAGRVMREHSLLAEEAVEERDWFSARYHLRRLLLHDPPRADAIRKRLDEIDRLAAAK